MSGDGSRGRRTKMFHPVPGITKELNERLLKQASEELFQKIAE
jgi:hypothetical protein